MTDKEKIKEEIERIIEEETPISKGSDYYHGAKESMNKLLQFIGSLPEEHNEDLEKEMIRWHKEHFGNKRDWEKTSGEYLTRESQLELACHFAEWQKQKDFEDFFKSDMTMPNKFYEKGKADAMKEMKETLQTEYEKGRFDMREELMKDAVNGEIVATSDNGWESIRIQKKEHCCGDKVKIVVLKTE